MVNLEEEKINSIVKICIELKSFLHFPSLTYHVVFTVCEEGLQRDGHFKVENINLVSLVSLVALLEDGALQFLLN